MYDMYFKRNVFELRIGLRGTFNYIFKHCMVLHEDKFVFRITTIFVNISMY